MSSGYTSGDSCCDGVDQSSDIPSYSSSIPNVEGSNSSDNDVIGKWIIPTTEATLHTLKQYLESYRQYVSQNPIWVSEAESALYWVSYLLSSKFIFFKIIQFNFNYFIFQFSYSVSQLSNRFRTIIFLFFIVDIVQRFIIEKVLFDRSQSGISHCTQNYMRNPN